VTKFGAGDEVTLKAKVAVDGGGCAVVIENSYDGHTVVVDRGALTLVKAADDPSTDPIGTVRRDAGQTFVRGEGDLEFPWLSLGPDGGANYHVTMKRTPITGAVPNTPAWDAWIKGELKGAPEFPGPPPSLCGAFYGEGVELRPPAPDAIAMRAVCTRREGHDGGHGAS
jgi:hypothetical protein